MYREIQMIILRSEMVNIYHKRAVCRITDCKINIKCAYKLVGR